MNSEKLHEYLSNLILAANLPSRPPSFFHESLACFIGVLARAIGAAAIPDDDLLTLSIRLLLLDDAVADMSVNEPVTEQIHFLIGMGFEQSGALLARFDTTLTLEDANLDELPFHDDRWYRLALAVLHYLAGGHRIQARTALRQLQELIRRIPDRVSPQYQDVQNVLLQLYRSSTRGPRLAPDTHIARLLNQQENPASFQELRLSRLVSRIHERRQSLLSELGNEDVVSWLNQRSINGQSAIKFWSNYLVRLHDRGITAFTQEQVGTGFSDWLQPHASLVVTLPTGSGKSVVGELLTALCLCSDKQAIWILPTRSLVRQVQRDLREAFQGLDVTVEELPTTEDFLPAFLEDMEGTKHVAVSTPEKLHALIRLRPDAAKKVGLVVVDEAHLLFKENRGTTVESVLTDLAHTVHPQFVLMTASLGDKTALEEFLHRMIGQDTQYRILASELRPTRRVNGVLTATPVNGKFRPDVLLYPPELPEEMDTASKQFRLSLTGSCFRAKKISGTNLTNKVVCALSYTGLRTLWFVSSRESAETQAQDIATRYLKRGTPEKELSESSIARLSIELGRTSIIEHTARFGVAPHHGSLTSLEQVFVEQWYLEGLIHTVIATPTLAEGVNLPADVAIVGFLTRRNDATGKNDPLSIMEIQNMLGRAGRAGRVPDGICLITDPISSNSASSILNRHKRQFFVNPETPLADSGLRQLLRRAVVAQVQKEQWLDELSELDFHEVQTLVSVALNSASDNPDPYAALLESVSGFPSLHGIPENELTTSISAVAALVTNLRRQFEADPLLLLAVKRTGFPLEVLRFYFSQLHDASYLVTLPSSDKIAWLDATVEAVLELTSEREWCRRLLGTQKISATLAVQTAMRWRAGSTIAELEEYWASQTTSGVRHGTHLKVGSFLSRKLSSLAQFWGALAVCWELTSGNLDYEPVDETIQKCQTLTREGVENVFQLEWLRQIGGVDRVLAHRLEEVSVYERSNINGMRHYIRQMRREWRTNPSYIEHKLGKPYAAALQQLLY